MTTPTPGFSTEIIGSPAGDTNYTWGEVIALWHDGVQQIIQTGWRPDKRDKKIGEELKIVDALHLIASLRTINQVLEGVLNVPEPQFGRDAGNSTNVVYMAFQYAGQAIYRRLCVLERNRLKDMEPEEFVRAMEQVRDNQFDSK